MNGLLLAATTAATNTVLAGPALPETGVSVLRLFGALLFVLALFGGGVWLARNWQRYGSRVAASNQPQLRILEVRPLGNRQALYVVGYEQQRLLIAAAPTGVTLLSQLPPGQTSPVAEPAAAPSFVAALQQVLNRKP